MVRSIGTLSQMISVFEFPSFFILLTLFAFKQLQPKWRVLVSLYARETVQLLQQETPDFTSPDQCPPNSLVDPETRSTTDFGDGCRNMCTSYKTLVHETSDLMQRSIDKHITNHRSGWSVEKAVVCMCEGERISLWTFATWKNGTFQSQHIHNRLFFTVYRWIHVVSCPFHCDNLKTN